MSRGLTYLHEAGHACVFGCTGSGKSHLVKAALEDHRGGALVIDPQEERDWPATYLTGRESLRDVYRALRRGAHMAYVPDKEPEAAIRLLSRFCQDFINGKWGDLWLVIDEAQTYAPKNVPSPLSWIATRGRVHGIKGIWVSQRPAAISHTLLTQARYHYLFYLGAFEDVYLRTYGLDGEAIRAGLGVPADHRYYVWDSAGLRGPFKE